MSLNAEVASLLDLDPDLAQPLDDAARREARSRLLTPLVAVAPGPWVPPSGPSEGGAGLGMLVVEGWLLRDVAVAQTACTELLGPGDVIRPWDEEPSPILVTEVAWRALSDCRLAVLDRALVMALAAWPSVFEALLARTIARVQTLAATLAIHSIRGLETRLLALLWHLADHHGRVSPDGVVLPLPLTHKTIALLAGATRPSVSTSLKELEHRGRLTRRADGAYVLHGGPPDLGVPTAGRAP
jgi:CRP/FNR family cyclic AMP-dependent transcriptional regulator